MRRLLLSTLVLFTLASGAVFAQQFSSLEERMTEAEFKAAGLDKLSPEELAALNSWLAPRVGARAGAVGAVAAADTAGFARGDKDEVAIVSSISGEFRGWDGAGDRITLDNGQVWEVTDSSARLKIKVENPAVTIEPGLFEAWYLKVEGYNSRARVKRIK
jgi:hypothetical protein